MEITCPSCNKVNQSSPCQRCGGDLEPLFTIRRAAQSHLALSATALKEGRADDACAHAEQSWSLYHSHEAARMAFLGCVQKGDPAAWKWFRRGAAAE